jgi:hypothetical protein
MSVQIRAEPVDGLTIDTVRFSKSLKKRCMIDPPFSNSANRSSSINIARSSESSASGLSERFLSEAVFVE